MTSKIHYKPIADKQSFWSAAIGTMFEYYDYCLMIFFSPMIVKTFFGHGSFYFVLTKSVLIWLVIFSARPLGGLFFGYVGDFYSRKRALLLTIYGITIATLISGLLPTDHHLRELAFILFLLTKFLQYFCFGGEYTGALVYSIELAPDNQEVYRTSILTLISFLGALVAAVFGIILTLRDAPDDAWRWVFIFGGVLSSCILFYRRSMIESPYFTRVSRKYHMVHFFRKNWVELVTSIFVGGTATLPFFMIISVINPLLVIDHLITAHEAMWLYALLSIAAIVSLYIVAQLGNKFSAEKIMKTGLFLMIGFAVPLFLLINSLDLVLIMIAEVVLVIFNQLFLGPSHVYLKNIIPTPYRYRAMAFGFSAGASLFSGINIILQPWIYLKTSHINFIALFLLFLAGTTFLLMYHIEQRDAKTA